MPEIRGRIIRIVDETTVVINLGEEHGIDRSSIFTVLGSPEPIVDPVTKEELGTVTVFKAEVKADVVFPRFTVATSEWTSQKLVATSDPTYTELSRMLSWTPPTVTTTHGGDLNVKKEDIQPWAALSTSPVQVGDEVEVSVSTPSIEEEAQDADLAPADEETDTGE